MNFKRFRQDRNLTQNQAADLFGISGAYWGELESGKANQRKIKQYGLALRYIDHPQIYNPIDPEAVKKSTAHIRYTEIENLTGFSASTWQTLKHNPNLSDKKWRVLVNAALLEIESKTAAAEPAINPEPVTSITVIEPSFNRSAIRAQFDEQDKVWFCLADICAQVGYQNTNHATQLINKDALQKRYTIDAYGREQEALFVTEGGMYQFLIRCHLPLAEAFTDWVTNEVLPSIRKTGSYSTKQPDNLSIVTELAKLVGMRTEQIERDFAAKLERLESRIENLPAQTLSAEEAAKATLDALAALNAKKSELHDLVMSIANAAKALPNDDPEAQYYSNYGNVWRTVHRYARPAVSSKNDYTSISQIQHAINGGQLILARLGGCTQLAIDLGAA